MSTPIDVSYWDIFRNAVEKYPKNVATILKVSMHNNQIYYYENLYEISCKFYKVLTTMVSKGEVIGLLMRQDCYLPSYIAAFHRCGCSFLFLDPQEDALVNEKTIKDFSVRVIFSKDSQISLNGFTRKDHLYDSDIPLILYTLTENLESKSSLTDNAFSYCIKTSGSTGIQKNVAVTHASIYPNIVDFAQIFDGKESDVVYFSTPLTFDPSMVELYLAAYCGAALLICEDKSIALCSDDPVFPTIWQTTPSLFFKVGSENIKKHILCENSRLKVLALGGEPWNPSSLLKYKHRNNATNIYNLYGITEMSCWASVCKIESSVSAKEMDIGEPLSETLIEVTTSSQDGDCIKEGLGLIKIGSRTRKCIVTTDSIDLKDFDKQSIQWHSTGDLGEIKSDGKIYFRGRQDRLVKKFGRKINLLEIESAALSHPNIQQAVCVWLPRYQYVFLMIISNDNQKEDGIKQWLKMKLQPHLVPDVIYSVDEIPLSRHGKIVMSKVYTMCETYLENAKKSLETFFAETLIEFLKIPHEFEEYKMKSFLDLGGNSLIAIQIANQIENILKTDSFPDLFTSLMNPQCSLQEIMDMIESKIGLQHCGNLGSPRNSVKRSVDENEEAKISKRVTASSDSLKNTIKVKWKVDLFKCIDANPIIYNDSRDERYVIVGSHSGYIAMVNATTGNLKHMWNVNSRVEAPVLCIERSQPICVVGTYEGELWCFSLTAPYQLAWKLPLNAMIKSQACCLGSFIFAATYEGIIWKVDLTDGSVISSKQITNGGISADLVIQNLNIFVGTLCGNCICLDISEDEISIKWKYDLSSPIFAKPTLFKNNSLVLFSEAKGIIHCLDSNVGNEVWKFSTSGPVFSSCLTYTRTNGDFITFGCHNHHSYHLKHIEDGNVQEEFRNKHSSQIFATPFKFKDSYIVYAATDGHLQIIDFVDKQIVCEIKLPGELFSTPLVLGDEIFIGCRDNYLYCLNVSIL